MRIHTGVLLLVVAAASLAEEPAAAPAAPPAPETAPAPTPAAEPAAAGAPDAAARFDELWKTRDDPATLKAADALIAESLKATPDTYDVLWRAARARWWVADGAADDTLKKQVAKEAWDFAARAQKAKPGALEGTYYTALSIGAYSQSVGILKAITEGLEKQYVTNLDAALKLNEGYDRYGGLRAKGRYYWSLPWPKRDLKKSREILLRAAEKNPEHLRNWLFLAETELKDGNPKEAKAAIEKVLNGSLDFDPPEGRRSKAWAKPVAAEIEKALK
ncbi:MAG: hypothetical protein JNG84_01050 [Archangium sp.]|nr:hypothetical protein [Archangium sp.]